MGGPLPNPLPLGARGWLRGRRLLSLQEPQAAASQRDSCILSQTPPPPAALSGLAWLSGPAGRLHPTGRSREKESRAGITNLCMGTGTLRGI